jgi:hypothetical protein
MSFVVEKAVKNIGGVGVGAISAGFWLEIDLEKRSFLKTSCAHGA